MLVLTALIWGVAFVAQSAGMDHVGPFTFNAVRMLLGGAALIPLVLFMDRRKKAEGGETSVPVAVLPGKRKKTALTGGIYCGIVLFFASTMQQIGILYSTVGKSGFITALYIIIVPIMGMFFKKKVPLTVWLAAALAVFGMYMLCINEGFSINKGDLYLLACAVLFATHILVIDSFSPYVDGVRMSCIQFFVAGALAAVCMFIFEKPNIKDILAAWLPIVYAGIMSCGVAYTLQIIAQKNVPPTVASLLMSLESVFAVLAGWVILGETLSLREILGCVIVFAAIILAQIQIPTGNKNKSVDNGDNNDENSRKEVESNG